MLFYYRGLTDSEINEYYAHLLPDSSGAVGVQRERFAAQDREMLKNLQTVAGSCEACKRHCEGDALDCALARPGGIIAEQAIVHYQNELDAFAKRTK